MNSNKYCVFVCTKQPTADRPDGCCGAVGATEIYQALRSAVATQNLADRVEVRESGCLNHCAAGAVVLVYRPNLVDLRWLPTKLRLKIRRKFFPSRYLYGHLQPTDIPMIVESHFVNGKPALRYRIEEDR